MFEWVTGRKSPKIPQKSPKKLSSARILDKIETIETIRTCPDLPKRKTPADKRNDVDSESTYETLLRLILEEHGITCHAQVLIGPYRVDLIIGDLIIEVDGWGKMKEGPEEAYAKQIARENWLKEQGFKILRVTPREINRNEVAVVRRVLDALEEDSRTLREVPRLYQPKGPSRQEFFPGVLAKRLGI